MNKSDAINELSAALAKAQGKMRFAIKDANNPFFKSKYADLSSVVEAIRDALSENGVSYIQRLHESDKHEVRVETVLLHSSGQWISCGILSVPVSKHDAQGFGSALTYARRYSLSAAVGVVADDDDGDAAAGAAPKPQAKPQPTPMPAKVKEAVKPKAANTISGDPNEGDLSGITPPPPDPEAKAEDVVIGNVIHAFASKLNWTVAKIDEEFGKPTAEWTNNDVNEARVMFKTLLAAKANEGAKGL